LVNSEIWISKVFLGFPNFYLAVLCKIKDLAICISKDFRAISKYFFGRFGEYQ